MYEYDVRQFYMDIYGLFITICEVKIILNKSYSKNKFKTMSNFKAQNNINYSTSTITKIPSKLFIEPGNSIILFFYFGKTKLSNKKIFNSINLTQVNTKVQIDKQSIILYLKFFKYITTFQSINQLKKTLLKYS